MKQNKPKALVVLGGNLATTPRAHKFINYFLDKLDFVIVSVNRDPKWEIFDKQLLPNGVELHYVRIRREEDRKSWIIAKLAELVAKNWSKINPASVEAVAYSSSKISYLIKRYNQSCQCSYDAVFSFSYASIFPAYHLANQLNIPFICDIEDYHPGELVSGKLQVERERREFLLRKVLPQAQLVTAASPLIAREVENLANIKVLVINNSFNKSEFSIRDSGGQSETIKLVWFSQTISFGRGLEVMIQALNQSSDKFHLTLIGNLDEHFAEKWIVEGVRNKVKVLGPVSQEQLHHVLSDYDIGLALELESTDYNRGIALTNKIFAYLQAGLYVLATDTPAQKELISRYPAHGLISGQTVESLVEQLSNLEITINNIRSSKKDRFKAAVALSFEQEAKKILPHLQEANLV